MSLPHILDAERGLVQGIGVRGLTASVINTTIGAGIFILPALVARDLGTAAPFAYLACALAMTLVVASFAMAGSRVSLTGGIYAYVEVAFGPLVGFVIGFIVWLSCLTAAAAVASALAGSMGSIVPALGHGIGKALLLAAIYGAFAAANVRGVHVGTGLVEVVTLAKLAPLGLLLAVGAIGLRGSDFAMGWAPPSQIGATSVTLIFAFMGVEYALLPSGEIKAPSRTIPRALFLALAVTTVLYLAIQMVAHAVLGPDLARYAEAPLAEAAARVLGPWGRALMLVGGGVSMLGMLSGDALTTPRTLFAFARDGFLPAALTRVHPRFRTPAVAIVAHAAIVCLVATIGTFGSLVLLGTTAMLAAYLCCCAAAIELRRRDVRMGGTPFALPGGPALPAAACLVLAWLLARTSREAMLVTIGTAAFAVGLYAVRQVRLRRRIAASVQEQTVL